MNEWMRKVLNSHAQKAKKKKSHKAVCPILQDWTSLPWSISMHKGKAAQGMVQARMAMPKRAEFTCSHVTTQLICQTNVIARINCNFKITDYWLKTGFLYWWITTVLFLKFLQEKFFLKTAYIQAHWSEVLKRLLYTDLKLNIIYSNQFITISVCDMVSLLLFWTMFSSLWSSYF
jgi:hypothetical protein